MDIIKDIGVPALFCVLGIIGWFLRSKDEAQAKQIALLFLKHDDDAAALSELKERIAREHYVKGELDVRFQRLEDAFTHGFTELGMKIDKLADAMMAHILKADK